MSIVPKDVDHDSCKKFKTDLIPSPDSSVTKKPNSVSASSSEHSDEDSHSDDSSGSLSKQKYSSSTFSTSSTYSDTVYSDSDADDLINTPAKDPQVEGKRIEVIDTDKSESSISKPSSIFGGPPQVTFGSLAQSSTSFLNNETGSSFLDNETPSDLCHTSDDTNYPVILAPDPSCPTGEEKEETLLSIWAKLYWRPIDSKEKNWSERGAGVLHLNDLKDGRYRMDGSLRVILNVFVKKVDVVQDRYIQFLAAETSEEIRLFLLKMKNSADAHKLISVVGH